MEIRPTSPHPRPPSLTIRFAIEIVNDRFRRDSPGSGHPGQGNIPINISYTAQTRQVWRVEGTPPLPLRGERERERTRQGYVLEGRARDSVVITLPRFFRGVRLLIPRVYIYACRGRTTTTTITTRIRRRRRRSRTIRQTKCKEEEQGRERKNIPRE